MSTDAEISMAVAVVFSLLVTVTHSRVLLYHTENRRTTEKFDCVYYHYDDGDEIPYCRRPGGPQSVDRRKSRCENSGEMKLFRDLINEQTDPDHILEWSSGMEIADLYADRFYNRSIIINNDDQFVCNCIKPGTFGKYCEYQLTHDAKTFSEAIAAQFEQKKDGDSWNTQRYGNILCYETLPCHTGPLCLDFREICDGVQRCASGIDEENWDKLEFNECEDNEFRCTNGMCIAEQFWLDGDLDCMDWSDEYMHDDGDWCSFSPNAMNCDERLCRTNMYSCGDGQCVKWIARMAFQRLVKATEDCYTKRNLNFMCEGSPHRRAWTLPSGLCWSDKDYDDPRYPAWEMIETSNLSNDDRCQYLFRCALTMNFERDCPCKRLNCTALMIKVCYLRINLVFYPPHGVINPNIVFIYDYRIITQNRNFLAVGVSGSHRCRGFFIQTTIVQGIRDEFQAIHSSVFNRFMCIRRTTAERYANFTSSFQHDAFCWNGSLTFNGRPYAVNSGICDDIGECISQYRIRDSVMDCIFGEDERTNIEKNYCTGNVGRQRFQCFNAEHKCLSLASLGTTGVDCSNGYDERYFATGALLQLQLPCETNSAADCHRIKEYIQQSSSTNLANHTQFISSQPQVGTNQIPFHYYCNSFWNLDDHLDELPSSCQHWICPTNYFRCRTGQCIPLQWICDGEWDCADASDEEGIELIGEWSVTNAHLSGLSSQLDKCRQRYSQSPFSLICNRSFELGCYRARVENPIDIRLNRPCINLTQIGDGVEDCFNAYDERNTFAVGSTTKSMWGFHFGCTTGYLRYTDACYDQFANNCVAILCSYFRDDSGACSMSRDALCLDGDQCKKGGRCNGVVDCAHGEDEYWCPSNSSGNSIEYRRDKEDQQYTTPFSLKRFPPDVLVLKQNVSQAKTNRGNNSSFIIHSYRCNRGVAVLQSNETHCLCPPAYYGRWCEFYSDRISVIVHLHRSSLPKTIVNRTLIFKVNLLFHHRIVDGHQFGIVATNVEQVKIAKHRFYLLYSRSNQMLEHKRKRYANRTDVITDHPYSVHFDAFAMEGNNTVRELGSWRYPIYFDYLPAFRLAVVLRFPSYFGNITLDPCQTNPCNTDAVCLPVFNENQSFYCSCPSGFYGNKCELYVHRCQTSCSARAFCRVDHIDRQFEDHEISCICPLGYFGGGCNFKFDRCEENVCLNNGTCLPNYDPSGETSFTCSCSAKYHGQRCEIDKTSIHVHLNPTEILSVRATVVQLYNLISTTLRLDLRHQQVYRDLPSSITYYDVSRAAPDLGIVKVYEDLANPRYFLSYFLSNQSTINISSSPRLCPHVTTFLSNRFHSSVQAIFAYHQICRNNTELFCFYDNNYWCVCENDNYRTHCFDYDTELDHCDKCLAGGKCLQGDPKDPADFNCFCPPCYQGHRCQFSLQAFGFTVDSLLVDESKGVKIVYATLVGLIFALGFLSNVLSFETFRQPIPRQFGVGNYLLIVTCLNQMSLLFLFFKFIEITVGSLGIRSCRAVSYSLAVATRSAYWMTSWVTVNRLLILLFPTSSLLKNARLAIGVSIATSFVVCLMHVHEMIYSTIIERPSTSSLICTTNFDNVLITTYNRVSTLIHYLVPFFIQGVSITVLIVLATRSRVRTVNQHKITFGQMLKKRFSTQKELYVVPMIIILSALPQTILTFSFACTQLNAWQRHALLVSYLFSYIPQVLSFILFVISSTNYKKEFKQTKLAKNSPQWMFGN